MTLQEGTVDPASGGPAQAVPGPSVSVPSHQATGASDLLELLDTPLTDLLDVITDGFMVLDADWNITYVNGQAEKILGQGRSGLEGCNVLEMFPELVNTELPAAGRRALAERRSIELREVAVPGRRWYDSRISPLSEGLAVSFRDVTKRVRAECERRRMRSALEHLAYHDSLTDLPNRLYLQFELEREVERASGESAPFALLMLDLDHFAEVNETFGHPVGDHLLREVARRIGRALRRGDFAARIGGDEFAILLPGTDQAAALQIAEALSAGLDYPFAAPGQDVFISAALGIVVAPAVDLDASEILRRAGVALCTAKQAGSRRAIYAPDRDTAAQSRLALAGRLRAAIADNQLELYYQPQIELSNGQLCGVEALARWRDPEQGLIPPDDFISLAERTGLIDALTRWVIAEALRQVRIWHDQGLTIPVSVNLSARNLHDETLPDVIAGSLAVAGVPPDLLRVEITESHLMTDPGRARAILAKLRTIGIRVAIDDFGTGYSSLAYLKRLAVDELKVDRSFVRHLTGDEHDYAIVRSTIDLGHNLGLRVVAEGVEDEATINLLKDLGCDVVQGYFLARPQPASEFEQWLAESPWRSAGIRMSAEVSPADRQTVLVVDDNPAFRQLLSHMLESEGYQVETAANGYEALLAIEGTCPDLLILDIHMPVLSGPGCARELAMRGIRIPTIIMTGDDNVAELAAEIRAVAGLTKPFQLSVLRSVLRQIGSLPVAHWRDKTGLPVRASTIA